MEIEKQSEPWSPEAQQSVSSAKRIHMKNERKSAVVSLSLVLNKF